MSKQFKRILALIIALALCVSLLPGVALAETPDEDQDEIALIDPADEETAEPEEEITVEDPAEDKPEDPLPPAEEEPEDPLPPAEEEPEDPLPPSEEEPEDPLPPAEEEPEDPLPPPEKEPEEEAGTEAPGDGLNDISEYPEITVGESRQVDIDTSYYIACFRFTPSVTKVYRFFSTQLDSTYTDSYGYLYDSDMQELTRDDDSNGNGCFTISYRMEAGKTYVLGAGCYSSNTGSFLVSFEEESGDYFYAYADGSDQFNVEYGGSCTLRVIAVTNNEVSYRWRYDYAEDYIEGADSDSLTLENVTERCQIICNVSDDQGHDIDVWFYVGIDTHLQVRIAGTDDTFAEYSPIPEESVTLAVDASVSVGGLRYVWYSEGSTIEGADESTYTLIAKSNQYIICEVFDDFGRSNTVAFQIYLNNSFFAYADESHSSYSRSINVPYGETAEMVVYAGCTVGELHYTWYDANWNEIENATDPLYAYGPVTSRETFRCEVSDDYGSSRTVTFYISVDTGLYAYCAGTEQKTSVELTVAPLDDVTLEVVAGVDEGAGEVHYQWYRYDDWEKLDGETGSQLILTDIAEYSSYYCEVSDDYGTSIRVYFYLYIDNGLNAYVAGTEDTSASMSFAPGSSFTLEVEAICISGSIHFQWYNYNDGRLEGETSAALSITDFNRSGTYYCYVTDDFGGGLRVYFYVDVENHLRVYAEGTDGELYKYVYVSPTEAFTLGVVASCDTGELHYQWLDSDWNNIEGATGPTFEVTEGITYSVNYTCIVTDDYGSDESVSFYCRVDNHFVAYAHGTHATDMTFALSVGDDVDLIVDANCDYGEIHYQWMDGDWNNIEGANTDSYSVTDVHGFETYICRVSDDYGSTAYVYFYTEIDTGLYAYAAGTKLNNVYYYVDSGSSFDLAVDAGVKEGAGEIHYVWYVEDSDGSMSEIAGATGPQLSVTDITAWKRYQCSVSDDYGCFRYVTFQIEPVRQFSARAAGSRELYVKSGNSVTLKVIATGVGELKYQWHVIQDDQSIVLDGQTASSFTTGPITEQTSFFCIVEDQTGAWAYIDFIVHIDSELSARSDGSTYLEVEPGASVDLRVIASVAAGEIHYQWYHDSNEIEGATEDHFTAENITSSSGYSCYVRDDFGNLIMISFYISVRSGSGGEDPIPPLDELPELTLYEFSTAEITEPYTLAYFRFTPTETGYYRFYSNSSEDTYGYLYDAAHNQLAYNDDGTSNGYNFAISYKLTAGETYILGVRFFSLERTGSFPVTVDDAYLFAEADGGSSFSVELGGSVTMKVRAEGRGELSYIWYNSNWDPIPDAAGTQLTVSDIRKATYYICEVRDSYDNSSYVWFNISINSHLAAAADGDTTVYVDFKGSCTLGVIASVDSGELHYQWYRDGDTSHLLPNGNSSSYTVSNVISAKQLGCQVTDDFGNSRRIEFWIYIKSDLSAVIDGTSSHQGIYWVDPGDDLSLKVNASVRSGSVNYQWYRYNNDFSFPIGNQFSDPSVMELRNIQSACQYTCVVSDDYGNSISLHFIVHIENGFDAQADGPTRFSVEPGSSVTMKVKATADSGELHYQWYETYSDYRMISGATGESYTANNIQGADSFECCVWDDYGNTTYVSFQIGIENGFSAYAEGSTQIKIEAGSDVTLKVIAHADRGSLHYDWYETTNIYQHLDERSDSLTLTNVTSYCSYRCYVSDDYGNSANLYFYISIENGFSAHPDGYPEGQNWAEVTVPYGQSQSLKVVAKANIGPISYRWMDDNWNEIPGANSDTLTLTEVTRHQNVTCNVSDAYGNGISIYFEIFVQNNLHAYVKGTNWDYLQTSVNYGGSTTLEVEVKGDDLSGIQTWWEEQTQQADGYYYTPIGGVNGYSLTVSDVTASRRFRFRCTDKYGNPAYVNFTVEVDNNFQVYCNDTNSSYVQLRIPENSSADLYVRVAADNMENLTYRWFMYELDERGYYMRGYELTQENGPSIKTANLRGNYAYECRVTDFYGSERYAYFEITASDYKLDQNNARVAINKTIQLKMLDSAGKTVTATWSSSDPDIATVNQNGVVTGKKYGYTTITAVAPDGSFDTCTVMSMFSDVTGSPISTDPDYQYFFNPVYWAAERGITKGYESGAYAGKFGVDLDCQRRELMIFLWRYAGEPTLDKNGNPYGDAQTMFNDLKGYGPTTATNKAIAWAYKEGITKGYSDGGFHPTAPIVRKDVMILLYRLAGRPAVSGTLNFPDCQGSPYTPGSDTYNAILWGSQTQITKGYSDGTFGPMLNCKREQIVTFLYRFNNLG